MMRGANRRGIAEDCGVALWAVTGDDYGDKAFVANLQICGPIHAVKVALERLRAVRASASRTTALHSGACPSERLLCVIL